MPAQVYECVIAGGDWVRKINRHIAALLALASHRVSSKSTLETVASLNDAALSNEVHLRWIKAHVGHEGNEAADQLAKSGATNQGSLAGDLPAVSYTLVKGLLRSRFREQWNIRWQNSDTCRQTKQWFPAVNQRLSDQLLRLDRKNFSGMVQFITGHNYLNRHEALIDSQVDPLCRFCLEEEETSFHIIAECPALAVARFNTLGAPLLTLPLVWSVSQVASFLREARIGFLLDPFPPTGLVPMED